MKTNEFRTAPRGAERHADSQSVTSQGRLSTTAGIGLSALLFILLVVPAWAAERQALHGHVPAAVAYLQPTGRPPGTVTLNLAIGLPLRNQEELSRLLQQLYDPASPNYRHYLTPAQFAERFGPAEQDYQAVINFAKASGLTVTTMHPNRLVLDVSGTIPDIEKAFHLTMHVYRHPKEARTFYAPDVEPSLDLAAPVLSISGLDNYGIPRPMHRVIPLDRVENAAPNAGSGPNGTYMGYDFRAAYLSGATNLTGTGQSVGLLQFDAYYANDIATYETQAGLPAVTLTNVPINGGVGIPGPGNNEVALDIEMVISMAPGISNIIVYEAPNPSPWVSLLSRMANDNLAKQLSCSWGNSSPGGPDAASEQIFLQMAAQGQSFFNASGDFDAFTNGIAFPAESTNITQVGGTTLTTSGPRGNYVSETVWNWGPNPTYYIGSGGGVSSNYTIPVWQQGISMVSNLGSTNMRNVPDVALTADNVHVIASNGVTLRLGGTSCAAPLWAGLTALINQEGTANGLAPVGFLNPTIYTLCQSTDYASCFHDITTGNNTNLCSANKFFAVAGYDLCTGWGTPIGASLINALTGVVYVDHAYAGPAPSDGSLAAPFLTVTEGYQAAHYGNIICVFTGNYPETLVMSKRFYLRGTNGLVKIGSP